MIINHEDHLMHYGILRRSGRYPWGSGASESTRHRSFLDVVDMHRKDGMTDSEIAKGYDITRNQLTAARSIALASQKQEKILQAQRLKDKGLSNVKIGAQMGLNESSVRALLAPGAKDKADALQSTASMIEEQFKDKKYLDVGTGVEAQLGVTRTRLDTAVAVLQEKGYGVHNVYIPQVTQPGKYTTMKVLAPPGVTKAEIDRNRQGIDQINSYSENYGRSYLKTQPPIQVNSRRIGINYAEDGGAKADGVIYVRPGVKDLSLGGKNYGQVRIAVDGTHYLKGMAVYKDDLPAGKDLVFNTNKSDTGRKKDALKKLSDDPDLPFGSIVRQVHGPDGKVISAMNIVGSPVKEGSGVEGSWDDWSKTLASQMLSKQSPALARSQLDVTYEQRQNSLDEIKSLTNPTVRKKLLEGFADSTDSSAVHMEAAAMKGQTTKVLLPVSSMKPTEVYAPGLPDGTRVALIRFPHGGTFEIPELTVNSKNREAKAMLGINPTDAIGIHHSVAEHLSGADFDGDTVVLIPNDKGTIKSTPALEGLKGFDPNHSYPPYDGMRTIDGGIYNAKTKDVDFQGQQPQKSRKQNEMGKISNLITDMTLHAANTDELARAVRHSMVVIDSEKHMLDFKASERDNGIYQLREKYQPKPGGRSGGASTLISKARSDLYIPERRLRRPNEGGPVDPVTGKKVFVETGRLVPDRRKRGGEYVTVGFKPKTERVDRLSVVEDAHKLSSGTQMEDIYAEHSNKLKSMANAARKEALSTKPIERSPSAAKTYANEVSSLNAKLNVAEKNAPLERQAQKIAETTVSQKRQSNPGMDPSDIKKIKNQALYEARINTGASKTKIQISPEEWNAIQAGALSNHKLTQILNHADQDTVRKLATPRHAPTLSGNELLRAKAMLSSGYTQAEIAQNLGVSVSTLKSAISE